MIFSFKNGIKLLKAGFKCSYLFVNDANVMQKNDWSMAD